MCARARPRSQEIIYHLELELQVVVRPNPLGCWEPNLNSSLLQERSGLYLNHPAISLAHGQASVPGATPFLDGTEGTQGYSIHHCLQRGPLRQGDQARSEHRAGPGQPWPDLFLHSRKASWSQSPLEMTPRLPERNLPAGKDWKPGCSCRRVNQCRSSSPKSRLQLQVVPP